MIAPPAWTLAVAESLTSGRLQAAIGERSGASDYFLGGLTAYTIDQKVTHLGVDRDEADRTNAVSEKVADEMVLGVCRLFGRSRVTVQRTVSHKVLSALLEYLSEVRENR